MANHEVPVGASVAADNAALAANPATGGDELNVSHLRPMSEGVLHAAGLHGGVDENGKVRDLRGKHALAVDIDPSTLPSNEPHVRKMKLEHKTGGLVETHHDADGQKRLRLIHSDGDVTTAKAATVEEALELLITKMGGIN